MEHADHAGVDGLAGHHHAKRMEHVGCAGLVLLSSVCLGRDLDGALQPSGVQCVEGLPFSIGRPHV
jgi:hypothetical protein